MTRTTRWLFVASAVWLPIAGVLGVLKWREDSVFWPNPAEQIEWPSFPYDAVVAPPCGADRTVDTETSWLSRRVSTFSPETYQALFRERFADIEAAKKSHPAPAPQPAPSSKYPAPPTAPTSRAEMVAAAAIESLRLDRICALHARTGIRTGVIGDYLEDLTTTVAAPGFSVDAFMAQKRAAYLVEWRANAATDLREAHARFAQQVLAVALIPVAWLMLTAGAVGAVRRYGLHRAWREALVVLGVWVMVYVAAQYPEPSRVALASGAAAIAVGFLALRGRR